MHVDDMRALAIGRGVNQPVVPFEVTSAMVKWARASAPRAVPEDQRMVMLAESLLDEKGPSIDYSNHRTQTAIEAFEEGKANCLSFTLLFVAMAREVGVPAYFLSVRDISDYQRDGNLVVISDHIAVGYGPSHDLTILDFSSEPNNGYRQIQPVTDTRATAMFYSNRGAEALRDEQLDLAVRWLSDAVRIDPGLAVAWVNLGVALRRSGDSERAEEVYRTAIEVDPDTHSAYHNLAALLRMSGRDQEADEVMAFTATGSNRNPFTYVQLGDMSLRHGRVLDAERFYRRAMRLGSKLAEPLAALGLLNLAEGNEAAARRFARKATRIDPDDARLRVLLRGLSRQDSNDLERP